VILGLEAIGGGRCKAMALRSLEFGLAQLCTTAGDGREVVQWGLEGGVWNCGLRDPREKTMG
jgi:hypothetical protein